MSEGDLFKVIGKVPMAGYCGRDYWKWEEQIAQPRLEALGFTVNRWYTIDGDSFGPLVRGVNVVKDGDKQTLSYG